MEVPYIYGYLCIYDGTPKRPFNKQDLPDALRPSGTPDKVCPGLLVPGPPGGCVVFVICVFGLRFVVFC